MSSDILDEQILSSTRLGLSAQWSGLDIDDIPTSRIEKERYQFWCKNGGKMVDYAYD